MWQAWLMAKSKLTAREKSRQERERARSLEDRLSKAAQLRQKAQHQEVGPAAAEVAKPVLEEK